MRIKKSILLLVAITFSASAGLVQAQHSAQAAMVVTAQVIKGSTAVADLNHALDFGQNEITGTLGSISLSGEGLMIKMQDELSLENEQGEKIILPVSAQQTKRGQQVVIRFNTTSDGERGRDLRGLYSGSLTTTIAYL